MKKLIIICTCLAVAAISVAEADAQDYKSLRTKTWSIYGQGGISWAIGLDFKNVDPTRAITIAPEFGAGVNYNLRPWIRLVAIVVQNSFVSLQYQDVLCVSAQNGVKKCVSLVSKSLPVAKITLATR